jgi:hypothetical protein
MLGALALLAGCSEQRAQQAPALPSFHDVMKDRIDVHADEVWAIANSAITDDAGIDPARLTDADWQTLAARAGEVQAASLILAKMDPVVVAKPGVKIADDGVIGGHTTAQVQGYIDGNPAGMRAMAEGLASHMGDLASAAKAHDPVRTALLVDQLDGVCEGCHLEYWYPNQKALIEQYGIKTR